MRSPNRPQRGGGGPPRGPQHGAQHGQRPPQRPSGGGGGGVPSDVLAITSQSAIAHLLAHRPKSIRRLRAALGDEESGGGRAEQLLSHAQGVGVCIERVAELFDGDRRVSLEAWVTPVLAASASELIEKLKDKPRATVLLLDHLQDPQNFGAICRTAEGLGVDGVFMPRERSVPITAGVFAASAGAVATLPIADGNLGECARRLKDAGFWIVTASVGEKAEAPWKMPDFDKVAIVLGAEWKGVSALLEKLADWRVEIPLAGKIESLNVSVAGALILYERFRATAQSEPN